MASTTATTVTTVAHHVAHHHIPASTVIAIAGIVVGTVIAMVREWFAARERRRARPVVITNEVRTRHFTDGTKRQVATVCLTNDSAAAAFNIRFGVEMAGAPVPWKHDHADDKPNRVNVIRPGESWPSKQGTVDIVIPDEASGPSPATVTRTRAERTGPITKAPLGSGGIRSILPTGRRT